MEHLFRCASKEKCRALHDGLTQLLQIDPVSFQYNKTSGLKDTDARYIGIIAQDMLEIAPYMVETIGENAPEDDKTDLDGYYSYDGTALTYMLVNAVKEQQAIIDALMDKNEFLETELQAIKARLCIGGQSEK